MDEGWLWQWGGPSLLHLCLKSSPVCPCRRAAGTLLSVFMKCLIERPQPIRSSWNGDLQDVFASQFPAWCLQRAGTRAVLIALPSACITQQLSEPGASVSAWETWQGGWLCPHCTAVDQEWPQKMPGLRSWCSKLLTNASHAAEAVVDRWQINNLP